MFIFMFTALVIGFLHSLKIFIPVSAICSSVEQRNRSYISMQVWADCRWPDPKNSADIAAMSEQLLEVWQMLTCYVNDSLHFCLCYGVGRITPEFSISIQNFNFVFQASLVLCCTPFLFLSPPRIFFQVSLVFGYTLAAKRQSFVLGLPAASSELARGGKLHPCHCLPGPGTRHYGWLGRPPCQLLGPAAGNRPESRRLERDTNGWCQ